MKCPPPGASRSTLVSVSAHSIGDSPFSLCPPIPLPPSSFLSFCFVPSTLPLLCSCLIKRILRGGLLSIYFYFQQQQRQFGWTNSCRRWICAPFLAQALLAVLSSLHHFIHLVLFKCALCQLCTALQPHYILSHSFPFSFPYSPHSHSSFC